MKTNNTIQIGAHASYLRVHEINGWAVWSKTGADGHLSWLIARRPSTVSPSDPPPPASVCQEYKSESAAVAALERWAATPRPPKARPRARQLLAFRRNSNTRRRRLTSGPGQIELKL